MIKKGDKKGLLYPHMPQTITLFKHIFCNERLVIDQTRKVFLKMSQSCFLPCLLREGSWHKYRR